MLHSIGNVTDFDKENFFRADQNKQISWEKKSGFIDSEFVKTCDELVIGEEEGIQLRKQKREQQLFKRRNVHTEEIIQVIFNGILSPKLFLPSVTKKEALLIEKNF